MTKGATLLFMAGSLAGFPQVSAAADSFIACPVKQLDSQVTTTLPQDWWSTPQRGDLIDTEIATVAGQKTLVCNYRGVGASRIPVMRELPAGVMACAAAKGGFNCSTTATANDKESLGASSQVTPVTDKRAVGTGINSRTGNSKKDFPGKKPPLPSGKGDGQTATPAVLSTVAAGVAIQPMTVAGFSSAGQRNQPTVRVNGDAAALSAFYLKFENGDHKVSRLSLLRFPGVAQPALNDNDGNDPFTASARYFDLGPDNRILTQSATCRATCDVPLQSIGKGQTALLAGFSFERPDRDNNVRAIAVRLDPARRIAVVSLIDDGGTEVVSERPGAVAIGHDNAREYRVTVQYLVIDAARIKDTSRVSGMYIKEPGRDSGPSGAYGPWFGVAAGSGGGHSRQAGSSGLQQAVSLGWSASNIDAPPHALQGFEFRFTNGDHYLQEIGVNLARRDEIVSFQDSNRDDVFSWNVDYAVLKPPGE